MERLEAKKISGKTYYYYSKWEWVNGKCRRVWQKYLGNLETIVKAVTGETSTPLYAEIFQWGLPTALWKECQLANVIKVVDKLCPKRNQGMSTGEYLAIATLNRAISPKSKRSMWDWFSQTVLLRYLPHGSKTSLTSQRFWDHMNRISAEKARTIWQQILIDVVTRESIDLSSISYDGTNFYSFIDTFNTHCNIAKRGKNKQGRTNLRQISYALFCSADGHLPLFYEVYEGSRNDAKQFPLMLRQFRHFLNEISEQKCSAGIDTKGDPDTTLIFDKGNNSAKNFALIDSLELNYVGSVKLNEHKDLAQISNRDSTFAPCSAEKLKRTKAFRVKRKVYGQDRILVVTYNENLFNTQWLTLQNDITKAVQTLSLLQQKLEDRVNGVIKRGNAPTVASVKKQCDHILSRPYLEDIIQKTIRQGSDEIPRLEYSIDTKELHKISDTYLGKNILITNREKWNDEKIIEAYRSQFIIENVFKDMKDRDIGSWWPLHHWTDSKIKVHALYCTIAILLRSLMMCRIRKAGLSLSTKRIHSELNAIREVINIYPRTRRKKTERKHVVLSKISELQQQLISILSLDEMDFQDLG